MIVEVYIEGQRLDLHNDEGINVKQVSKDLKDISKIYGDFSQSFTVPASNRNNQIFKHYYNANIDGGYDARTRKPANIVVGGFDFKWGKMRLDKVQMNNQTPVDYTITFFGNAIKVKDLIKDDRLFDLDWLSNFDHEYNGTVVKDGLINGLDFTVDSVLYEKAIVYPLISYRKRYIYNSHSSDHTNEDTIVNIAHHPGHGSNEHGVDYRDLKPAISLYLIVKAIEEQYGFNFNSPFFDSVLFKGIYMNLNNSVDILPNGIALVEEASDTISINNVIITMDWRYRMIVEPKTGFENIPYKRRLTFNGTVVYEDNNFVTGDRTKTVSIDLDGEDNLEYNLKFEIITNSTFEFDAETRLSIRYYSFFDGVVIDTVYENTYTDLEIAIISQATNYLQDIKVIDFLTALFKMFNLIAVADGDDIYVQDLQSWYAEGQIYDITQFVENKKEVVSRGDIFKQINFNFERSEQILADEFRQSNNQTYGDLDFILSDANGNPLQDIDGTTLGIKTIFENPIFERLFDLDDNSETPIQYGLYTNRQIEPIVGKPFLFYANSVDISTKPIGFLDESTETEIDTNVLMPFHSQFISNSFNLNFNAQISEYTSEAMLDTIYQRFFSDYIGDMFSVKRRIYKFEAILPVSLLNALKLNDRLLINGTRYIINSISSNLTQRRDTLELINDIYDAPLLSDTLNTSAFRQSFQSFDANENRYSVTYLGVNNSNIEIVDLGFGDTWITLDIPKTQSQNFEILFTVEKNGTGAERSAGIRVMDGINNPIFIVLQEA